MSLGTKRKRAFSIQDFQDAVNCDADAANILIEYAKASCWQLAKRHGMKRGDVVGGEEIDNFIDTTISDAWVLTVKDYQKGLFRDENSDSFKKFFWQRIRKAFEINLYNLWNDPGKGKTVAFRDDLGKYYDKTAISQDKLFDQENDTNVDQVTVLEGDEKPVLKTTKKDPSYAEPEYYSSSAEKAEILEEQHKQAVDFANYLRSKLGNEPGKQMILDLAFGLNLSPQDEKEIEELRKQKVREPYAIIAARRLNTTPENARVIFTRIKKKLGEDMSEYREYRNRSALPGVLEFGTSAQRTIGSTFSTFNDAIINSIESLPDDQLLDVLIEFLCEMKL